MLHELHGDDRLRACALCVAFDYQLACRSVLAALSPGRCFVDDTDAPAAGFVLTPEGGCLVGNPAVDGFVAGLAQLFGSGGGLKLIHVPFVVSSESWLPVLRKLSATGTIACIPRQTYLCEHVSLDWRERLPSDMSVAAVDAELLDEERLECPPHLDRWMRSNWITRETFLAQGFGVVTRCGKRVVSWSLCDCAWEDRCEIGIHSDPAWRRRGLGAITAAAATEHALGRGYSRVGWHCNSENIGSVKTAERVGYVHKLSYSMYFVCG